MIPTDLPNLPKTSYGRADALKRELTEFVNYAQANPLSSANAMSTWFDAAALVVQTKLDAASPQVEV